jgi:putative flavoprotein involved in K+ transport
MVQKINTTIIGGGQAGLATSYFLTQQGQENIVLEQASQAGNAWRNDRWDSFTLLTPNWSIHLPGAEYRGAFPNGFMLRDEIVALLERYVDRFHIPVHYQEQVISVEKKPNNPSYLVTTNKTAWEANNVVIATGLFQHPKVPSLSGALARDIMQLHSGEYRNPQSLPPGAVLVIGSAQSGCQIAEELYQSGRKVYLCVGSAGRVPRTYRGKDVYEWMQLSGFLDRTVDKLPNPKAKFAANPHVSGKNGGHTLNLHQFARDQVTLLGHIQDGLDNRIWLSRDLKESLAKADQLERDIVKMIDQFIVKNGLQAPPERLPELKDGFEAEEISEIDLHSVGITSIIWAMGYGFDFSLVKLPVLDSDGFPIQKRGITEFQGLYFVGLPWLYKYKSGHFIGFGEDAEFIASDISSKRP